MADKTKKNQNQSNQNQNSQSENRNSQNSQSQNQSNQYQNKNSKNDSMKDSIDQLNNNQIDEVTKSASKKNQKNGRELNMRKSRGEFISAAFLYFIAFAAGSSETQYSFAPAGMCGSTISRCSFSSSPSL